METKVQSHADTHAASGLLGRPSVEESAALRPLAEEVQPKTHARTQWTEPRKRMDAGAAG